MANWPLLRINRSAEDDITPGTYKVAVTPNAAAHTKGNYAQISAALPFTICGLLMQAAIPTGANYLLDIAVGGAGSETIIVPNYHIGASNNVSPGQRNFFIPLSIPAGLRLSMRCQAGGAAQGAINVKAQFLAESGYAFQAPTRWEAWGIATGTTLPTATTSGVGANTKGSFVQLIAATAFTTRWIALVGRFGVAAGDYAIDLAIGTQVIIGDILNQDVDNTWMLGPFPFSIPAGSQIQARSASAVGNRTVYLGAYGGA